MKKRYQTITGISTVLVLVVALQIMGVLRPIENMLTSVFFSLGKVSYENQVSVEKDTINTKLTTAFDPELLQAVCAIDGTENTLLREENEELRKQLSFFSKNKFVHVGAEVIGRTVDPLSTVVVMNRGLQDGVYISNPVVVGEGVLVGTVIEVFETTSFVRLISDTQSRIGATLLNKEKTIGLVEGGYDIGVQMNFIPQNEVVSPGDTVVTSGLSDNMPPGLLIGSVEYVEKQPLEPFQQAILNPLADLSYLTLVSVIIPEQR
jgi:rod shape-determining protein MreC